MPGPKSHAPKVVKPAASSPSAKSKASATPVWTFFSNHAHVLFCLAGDPHMLLKDVAVRVGVTERAVLRIVAELEQGGVLQRVREGRRNRYLLIPDAPLRHPVEAHCTVGELLAVVNPPGE